MHTIHHRTGHKWYPDTAINEISAGPGCLPLAPPTSAAPWSKVRSEDALWAAQTDSLHFSQAIPMFRYAVRSLQAKICHDVVLRTPWHGEKKGRIFKCK